jgi:hypothetical protein
MNCYHTVPDVAPKRRLLQSVYLCESNGTLKHNDRHISRISEVVAVKVGEKAEVAALTDTPMQINFYIVPMKRSSLQHAHNTQMNSFRLLNQSIDVNRVRRK